MIERLEKVDDLATRIEIDNALEASDNFDEMAGLFEELACSVGYADQKYLEGEMSGLNKWYRKRTDKFDVRLSCKVSRGADHLPPSFELTVKPIDQP